MKDSKTTVAGLRMRAVDPTKVRPNPWNPNRMDEATFAKELESIRQNGFVVPVTIRVAPDGADEIVDGEHRTRAAVMLGLKEIPAVDLGAIDDQQAKKLTIIANELKGRPEAELLAKLVVELTVGESIESLATVLPYTPGEIEGLLASTAAFDWSPPSEAQGKEEVAGAGKGGFVERTGAEHRRVSIGRIAGTAPSWIVDRFVGEFERTAAIVRSTSIEAVFGDWLRRLSATAPAPAAVPPPEPPKPEATAPSQATVAAKKTPAPKKKAK